MIINIVYILIFLIFLIIILIVFKAVNRGVRAKIAFKSNHIKNKNAQGNGIKKNFVNNLKSLKILLDNGALTKKEFNKAKKN